MPHIQVIFLIFRVLSDESDVPSLTCCEVKRFLGEEVPTRRGAAPTFPPLAAGVKDVWISLTMCS